MALKSKRFKPFYNSLSDDLLEDFYIPALSNATEYKRVSAFFDSNILSLYSIGIENIVLNKGHIKFIFSSEISEKDFEMMKDGYKKREEVERGLIASIENENPSIEISNLAFLIQIGIVDVKIAFTKKGILHDKFGLINEGNDTLYFRGSNNETVAAIQNNYESFETSCSWLCDINEKSKIDNAISGFDKLWQNNFPGTIVVDIPEAVKEKILSFSKGKLLLSFEKKENTFVFDLDDAGNLIGLNNLQNPAPLLPGAIWFKGYLSYFVKNNPIEDGMRYIFTQNISYLFMRKIINLITDKGIERGFDVYLSPRLRLFLTENDIQAEKRKSLGTAIKNKSQLVKDAFDEFKDVVNRYTVRKLREPQLWDSFHIAEMKRAANFSVPGSGKTSIVYGAFAYLFDKNQVDKIVMIGTINSFLAWKNEFVLNFGSNIKLSVFDYQLSHYRNPQERYDGIINDSKNCNLILFNYESVTKNEDALRSIVNQKTLLVFDEVHRIKSTDGVRALSCLKISKQAFYKVVLTGTPIPNGFVDIYNFLHILFPDEYDLLFDFDKAFLESANKNEEKKELINAAIYPFFCRTTKKDLMVPPPEEDDICTGCCVFDQRYERLLEIVYRACSYNSLLLYIRLMQVSTNPRLLLRNLTSDDLHSLDSEEDSFDFSSLFETTIKKEEYSQEDINYIRSFNMSEKFFKCIEMAKRIVESGNQVIIWAVFIDTIAQTKIELRNRGISCEVIFGGTSVYEREAIINRFIKKEFDVLITNPHTLAESVSLHKNCHHAIYLEYSFNLVHMLQSRDRIHRLGLEPTEKTHYYYMMTDNQNAEYNTIDRKIYERLKEKEAIQEDAVEGDALVFIEDDFKKDIEELLADAC